MKASSLSMRFHRRALVVAVFLSACSSSSTPPAPRDGAATDADARIDAPAGDLASDADGPLDGAATGGDSAATDADAGVDAPPACSPACGSGKTCVDGACLPAPAVLARISGCGAARLALAGDTLYWTEHATGAVKKLALAGDAATPALVASGQMSPGPITADDTAVYWSNDGDHTIRAVPVGGAAVDGGAPDGGGATPLLTAPAAVDGLLASGGVLYYSADTSTYKVARTGGASTTLATFPTCRGTQPRALALGGDYIFQTDTLLQFITRARTDGTQAGSNPCVAADAGAPQINIPETVSHSQGQLLLDALYVAAGEVVWADHGTVSAKSTGVPTQAMSRQVATTTGSNSITGFVVAGASVYFGEGDDVDPGPTVDTIQVAPLGPIEGGADTPSGTVLATGQHGASAFVADATHVYWVTRAPAATARAPDDCTILSLAR